MAKALFGVVMGLISFFVVHELMTAITPLVVPGVDLDMLIIAAPLVVSIGVIAASILPYLRREKR